MVEYYYHNRDEGSLYFRVTTAGQGWEDDEYELELSLTSPGGKYLFHKTGYDVYHEYDDDVAPSLSWTRDLFSGANVTYVLYYGQRLPPLSSFGVRRRRVKKTDRVLVLDWDLRHRRGGYRDWGTITSRVYLGGKDVDVRLDQGVYNVVKEE